MESPTRQERIASFRLRSFFGHFWGQATWDPGVGIKQNFPTAHFSKPPEKLAIEGRSVKLKICPSGYISPPPKQMLSEMYHLISSFCLQKSYHTNQKQGISKARGAAPPQLPRG